MKKGWIFVFSFCFVLFPMDILSTIAVGKKAPCPLCRMEVKYTDVSSTYGNYNPDFHEPFHQLYKRFYLIFHCRHCGFSLFVYHYKKLMAQYEPFLNQDVQDNLSSILQSSGLIEQLDIGKDTPIVHKYELMERVYTVLFANKAAATKLEFKKERFWRDFYTDMTLFYYMKGNGVLAKKYADMALHHLKWVPHEKGPGRVLERKEFLLISSPLKFFSGNISKALSGYWDALQLFPRSGDEDELGSNWYLDNCIGKDISFILKDHKSISWLNWILGQTIRLSFVVKVEPVLIWWSCLFWLVLVLILAVLIKWNQIRQANKYRRFFPLLFSFAIPVLFYFFFKLFVLHDSYFTFLAVSGLWALLTAMAERLARTRESLSGLCESRPWYFARAFLIFSPLVIGLFNLKATFRWLPILFPLPQDGLEFPASYFRDEDGAQLFFHGLILFASILILCWLILICIKRNRKTDRSQSLIQAMKNSFLYSLTFFLFMFFGVGWFVVFRKLFRRFGAPIFPLVLYLVVGITWFYIFLVFKRFLVHGSRSDRSFVGVYRQFFSRVAWRWAGVAALSLPVAIGLITRWIGR